MPSPWKCPPARFPNTAVLGKLAKKNFNIILAHVRNFTLRNFAHELKLTLTVGDFKTSVGVQCKRGGGEVLHMPSPWKCLPATEVCRLVGTNLRRNSTHAHTIGGDFELKIPCMREFSSQICANQPANLCSFPNGCAVQKGVGVEVLHTPSPRKCSSAHFSPFDTLIVHRRSLYKNFVI